MDTNNTLILRDRAAIAEATSAQLVATYNALTGKSISKFENKEIGMRRVEQAMMAAADADAHLGVAKGANGEVKTAEELAVKAVEVGAPIPVLNGGGTPAEPVYAPGSLAEQLANKAKVAAPIVPRARREPVKRDPNAPRRATGTHVRAVDGGWSKVRDNSVRGAVLAKIREAGGKPVAVEALAAHFDTEVRGYLGKLVEVEHIVMCDADGNIPTPAVPKVSAKKKAAAPAQPELPGVEPGEPGEPGEPEQPAPGEVEPEVEPGTEPGDEPQEEVAAD
jgi:hypothetical protein